MRGSNIRGTVDVRLPRRMLWFATRPAAPQPLLGESGKLAPAPAEKVYILARAKQRQGCINGKQI